jgi:hypothetical protein
MRNYKLFLIFGSPSQISTVDVKDERAEQLHTVADLNSHPRLN